MNHCVIVSSVGEEIKKGKQPIKYKQGFVINVSLLDWRVFVLASFIKGVICLHLTMLVLGRNTDDPSPKQGKRKIRDSSDDLDNKEDAISA